MLINGTIGNYIHQLNLNVILLKYNYYIKHAIMV